MSIRHTMISASAGSGKTYQLVRRYLHLLVCGVEPESIAAMTFTRKASGEFFNRILNRLSELADGKEKPEDFFVGMEPLPAVWPDFKKLLRETTQCMHRLRLGTLDSFFATVSACFPLELGLPLGAGVMAEEEAALAQEETLRGLVARAYRERNQEITQTLLEAFKEATFGGQEKGAVKKFMEWIEEGHALWLESDAGQTWGRPEGIWPEDALVNQKPLPRLSELPDKLADAVSRAGVITEKAEEKWGKMIQALRQFAPGRALPEEAEDLVKKVGKVWEELHGEGAKISLNRAQILFSGPAAAALITAARELLALELTVRCARTRGMAKTLALYEQEYAQMVRGAGRLSFADVQRLLGVASESWLTENEGTDLWYRLDSRYQHWLLDEFQDTSFLQWRVVHGLLEEVLQSEGADRSFFAVGDLKQSIYLWRNAEPRLFSQILARHPDHEGRGIQQEQLSKSYRSSQQVLDFVNSVLGDKAKLAEHLPDAAQLWQYERHVAHKTEMKGYAGLVWPGPVDEKGGEEKPTGVDLTLELLKELRPVERGLSCAILVRANSKGMQIAERIRSELGMQVVCESKEQPLVDNPVTLALLSLLQLAAHPADTYASEHLKMTPLLAGREPRETVAETQRVILEEGFLRWVAAWTERTHSVLAEVDDFTQHRLEQLADLAAETDAGGSRDLDAFIQAARDYTLRTRGASAAIQVMTVHASKGLEFDVVLLPDVSGQSLPTVKGRSLVGKRDDEGQLEWVLQPPVKDFTVLDEVLSAEKREAETKAGFEGLCRLYVAMTRAKRALYVLADTPPKIPETVNEFRLMRLMLDLEIVKEKGAKKKAKKEAEPENEMEPAERLGSCEVYWAGEQGERDWFHSIPVKPAREQSEPVGSGGALGALLREKQPMARRRTPSGEESFVTQGKALFTTGRDQSKELGTLVHEMLSHVLWVDEQLHEDADILSLMKERGYTAHAAYEKALPHVLRAVKSGAFSRPAGAVVKLWRERPFDVMLDGNDWITGTFDRVVVTESDAHVIDFKTDDLSATGARAEKVKGYSPQLTLYRQAVSRLTGLPLHRIRCTLVFTQLESGALESVQMQ